MLMGVLGVAAAVTGVGNPDEDGCLPSNLSNMTPVEIEISVFENKKSDLPDRLLTGRVMLRLLLRIARADSDVVSNGHLISKHGIVRHSLETDNTIAAN